MKKHEHTIQRKTTKIQITMTLEQTIVNTNLAIMRTMVPKVSAKTCGFYVENLHCKNYLLDKICYY